MEDEAATPGETPKEDQQEQKRKIRSGWVWVRPYRLAPTKGVLNMKNFLLAFVLGASLIINPVAANAVDIEVRGEKEGQVMKASVGIDILTVGAVTVIAYTVMRLVASLGYHYKEFELDKVCTKTFDSKTGKLQSMTCNFAKKQK